MNAVAFPPVSRRKHLSLVVPFFNEGAAVEAFHDGLAPVLALLPEYQLEIVCVDDGSSDDTLARLLRLASVHPSYRVIELSRNFGKEAALTAGLDAASGACVVPMDADLQDPPALLLEMIRRWENGADVVLARRADRSSDSWLKRQSASLFYRLHNVLSEIRIPCNVGDFRLMDRCVVEALKQLPERQRFMKGLFSWVGFRTELVDYVRPPRSSGRSKFATWKLWNFALEGVTSFSSLPLRVWTYVGFTGAALTSGYALFILLRTLLLGVDVPGYASLLLAVLFFGSLQLISVGLLGEYIGRIYVESKQRPVYVVRKRYGGDAAAHVTARSRRRSFHQPPVTATQRVGSIPSRVGNTS
jgi:polyisoprenyl-phosphate glycosyltransferase